MTEKREIIILVDDDVASLALGKSILEDKYALYLAPSGRKLFELLGKVLPDLILLDIEMPDSSGYEVIKRLKENPGTEDIPVIFLTVTKDQGSVLEGLNLGAIDFITKPFFAPLLLRRIEGHLLSCAQKKELKHYNLNLREMVEAQTFEIRNLQNGILHIVAEISESRSNMKNSGHVERTCAYLQALVKAMIQKGVYHEQTVDWEEDFLIPAAQLHDVGKLYISEEILNKPGRLSPAEFEEVKKHAAYGLAVIDRMKQSIGSHIFLNYAGIFAETHHERWDGSGYPRGLAGSNIPLPGRLMAIADVYDAIVSARPYRQPAGIARAREEIMRGAGSAFDPAITELFSELSDEFARIAESHGAQG